MCSLMQSLLKEYINKYIRIQKLKLRAAFYTSLGSFNMNDCESQAASTAAYVLGLLTRRSLSQRPVFPGIVRE
jgi:hypothetical protein